MHSTKHASSSIQALYRIFVVPALLKQPPRRPALQLPSSPRQTTRPFTSTPSHHAKYRAPEERAQRWNEEIRAQRIQIIDPTTNKPAPPTTKFSALMSFDPKTHRLVQLSPDPPASSTFGGDLEEEFIPVCKIASKKELYEQDKKRRIQTKEARKASKLASDLGGKTIELNWAIDPNNDLMHRMQKLKEFLEEGRRVEIVLAAKKRGRKASREECENVLRILEETVAGVEGTKRKEEMQGKIGGFVTMVFQGRPVKVKNLAEEGKEEEEEAEAEEEWEGPKKVRKRFETTQKFAEQMEQRSAEGLEQSMVDGKV